MTTSQIIPLPQPPMCAPRKENTVCRGEATVLNLQDGAKLVGSLVGFERDRGTASVLVDGEKNARDIDLKTVKIMHLPNLRTWIQATHPEEGIQEGLGEISIRQDFEVDFTDGDRLEGETLGFSTDRNGVYLFPAQTGNQYIHTFVPHNAIATYNIGPRIGEVLVENALITEEQIGSVLDAQDQQRDQPIGEYLRSKAVVTAMELEKALQQQQTTPNMRLGEILIGENLISEAQLEGALQAQKQNRSMPLGEILVTQGLVTPAEIQQSLAKKLGIPFVDLVKFQIDEEAIKLVPEKLARKFRVLPLYLYEGKLVVAVVNPMDWECLDAVRFQTGLNVDPVMASAEDIERAIDRSYSGNLSGMRLDDFDEGQIDELDETLDEAASADNVVVKLVNKIIVDAYHQNASDIHIEPYGGKAKTVIRIRKDGELVPYYEVPAKLRSAVVARIKIMAGLDISEKRKPQDGKIDFRKFNPLKIELRVATIPTAGGREDVVMRILAGGEPIPLNRLGLSPHNHERLQAIIDKPYGLFFVCGPTGSGKTTTLHSILGHLNTDERKIWTAEDPVEITQKGLRQVQVNPRIGFDFAAAMRAFLRADPDIIMVGEMRDKETTAIGIEASLTGHLVLSTLHTNSAPESIVRLLDMGMDPFNFADALLGVLAQRLTRRLCPHCKQPYKADEEEISDLLREYTLDLDHLQGMDDAERILASWKDRFADQDGVFTLFEPRGCDECSGTGFKGRVGLHELLDATDSVKRRILDQAPVTDIAGAAIRCGMTTLKQDGIEKVLLGLTDIHQVRKVCIK